MLRVNDPRKIGVYVCQCGTNIASKVDVARAVEFARGLPNVAIAREYKFMCSPLGQDRALRFAAVGIYKHTNAGTSGNLLLVGNSGTGKTTIGKGLAKG